VVVVVVVVWLLTTPLNRLCVPHWGIIAHVLVVGGPWGRNNNNKAKKKRENAVVVVVVVVDGSGWGGES